MNLANKPKHSVLQHYLRFANKVKQRVLQHYLLITAVLFGCSLFAVFKFNASWDDKVKFMIIGVPFTFLILVQKQKLEETRLFKELFNEFNTRYDELNEDLNRIRTDTKSIEMIPTDPGCPLQLLQPLRRRTFLPIAGLHSGGSMAFMVGGNAVFLQLPSDSARVERWPQPQFLLRICSA